jgi:hypothetical protein
VLVELKVPKVLLAKSEVDSCLLEFLTPFHSEYSI